MNTFWSHCFDFFYKAGLFVDSDFAAKCRHKRWGDKLNPSIPLSLWHFGQFSIYFWSCPLCFVQRFGSRTCFMILQAHYWAWEWKMICWSVWKSLLPNRLLLNLSFDKFMQAMVYKYWYTSALRCDSIAEFRSKKKRRRAVDVTSTCFILFLFVLKSSTWSSSHESAWIDGCLGLLEKFASIIDWCDR